MCGFHDSRLSKITPRNLALSVMSMSCPLTVSLMSCPRCLLWVNRTAVVLLGDILKPLLSHHFWMADSEFWIRCSRVELLLPAAKMALSSAKSDRSTPLVLLGMSLIIMRKRRGEITEPWGVPFSRVCFCDSAAPTLTWIVLSVRKSLTQSYTLPVIPRPRIFLIKVGTWIMSYAFSKSMNTPKTCSFPCRLLEILSCIRIIWSTVLLFFRNPAWSLVSISPLSRNHWNLSVTILSMILHREDVNAIGL